MREQHYVTYNPNDWPVDTLPTIYGFNNGGDPGWYSGMLLAEDGTYLGGHVPSNEEFMIYDLGIVAGGLGDSRHEEFKEHYPNGYRMEFISLVDVKSHLGLKSAYEKNQLQ